MILNAFKLGMPKLWLPPKLLLIMKLTTILLLLGLMQTSAASFAQKLTMKQNSASLREIFDEINLQTSFDIVVKSQHLQHTKAIPVNFKNQDVLEILKQILPQQNLSYTISDNTIIIKPLLTKPSLVENLVGKSLLIDPKGTVVDSLGNPLIGASITVKGTNRVTRTNEKGEFSLSGVDDKGVLVISYLGYETREIKVTSNIGVLTLKILSSKLDEVHITVVSTGYQTLPKERVTGSFVKIDNELLNRRVGPNILDRIADITPGLIFNKGALSGENDISIRGRSTISSNAQPLIVLDNFPYQGDLASINPNDIETITVLKDAASASIWGSMAGNGVIVLTTKRGNLGTKFNISFNGNVTVGGRPDAFYQPKISVTDYISIEKMLFERDFFKNREQSVIQLPLSPVVELLIAQRDGKISPALLDVELQQMSGYDVRNDIKKYLYRNSLNQQYALGISGAEKKYNYRVSLGYDRQLTNLVGNQADRLSLNYLNTFYFSKRLELNSDIMLSTSTTKNNAIGIGDMAMDSGYPLYPYARLADLQGNHLPLTHNYRTTFLAGLDRNRFLDWSYIPLDELANNDNSAVVYDFRINNSLRYRLTEGIKASIFYQLAHGTNSVRNLSNSSSFYTRDLINTFSQVGGNYPVPIGGILDRQQRKYLGHNFRTQLDLIRNFGKNALDGIIGIEIRQKNSYVFNDRDYGYDDIHAVSKPVDYINYYPYSFSTAGNVGTVPYRNSAQELSDRDLSAYANISYAFDKRYMATASIRRDESNLFGVNTNEKGVPLWSMGIAWNINQESFFKPELFSTLKVRATYGIGGNVNKFLSSYTTAYYVGAGSSATRLPYAQIANPPNPDLRWEKTKNFNLGLDFSTVNRLVNGSIDFFQKKGTDLIGTIPYAPSTGISIFTGNTASTLTDGLDLSLQLNLTKKKLKWTSNLNFSFNKDRVTNYDTKGSAANYVSFGGGLQPVPLVGKPLFSMYSYRWAGLDGQTGEPLGYINGIPSNDYSTMLTAATPENLFFHGALRPSAFGAFRNDFSYGPLNISFNISYRFGYYFRRSSVNYLQILNSYGGHGDFGNRWLKPGDEKFTQIPAMPILANSNRENFYQYSSTLVEKGDHIRLQDISLNYNLPRMKKDRAFFKTAKLYCYANNLGIIWKATKHNIDPDYQNMPLPRTVAMGVKLDF